MLPVDGGENARKPFPLSSNEALEASTTVKQRSIEVEDHRLYVSQHQVYPVPSPLDLPLFGAVRGPSQQQRDSRV